jgi:peptidoglycan/LPS O-acetylase OafA/YrhL
MWHDTRVETERIYFPNLNGLRFIAALLVIVHHLEQFKWRLHMKSRWMTSAFVAVIGKLGVVLFFVLSGFLITYLLLVEERNSGAICVGKFYVRRALRIWPLYFLTIGLGLVVFPHVSALVVPGLRTGMGLDNSGLRLALYLAFLPNLAQAWLGTVLYVSHTWSIGTEEQFYLLWPLVLSASRKLRPVLIASTGLLCLVARVVLSGDFVDLPFKRVVVGFLGLFNIDCMAIGGFAALLAFRQSRHLRWLRSAPLFFVTTCLLVVLLGKGIRFPVFHYQIYALLFAVLILNLATKPGMTTGLESGPLRYLGTISYGLYMYHPACIVLSIWLARQAGLTSDLVLYPLAIGLVVAVAAASYQLFERPFLRAKARFTVVASGDAPPGADLAPRGFRPGASASSSAEPRPGRQRDP